MADEEGMPPVREARAPRKHAAARRLAELDVRLPEVVDQSVLDELVRTTNTVFEALDASRTASPRISPVTGEPTPSRAELAAAQRSNLLRRFEIRRRLLEGSLTAAEVADMLGSASRQTPHDRVRAGTLLAVRDSGRLWFPLWQFDPEGPDGVLEGFPEVVAALTIRTDLARIAWFVTPKHALAGRTPLDILRDGDVDRAIGEAQASHAT